MKIIPEQFTVMARQSSLAGGVGKDMFCLDVEQSQ